MEQSRIDGRPLSLWRWYNAFEGAREADREHARNAVTLRVKELESDLEHCRKVDGAHVRGARAYQEGKSLETNPYLLDWDADYGTPGWTDKLLHGIWEDAWRRAQELDLLIDLAVSVKRYESGSVLGTGSIEAVWRALKAYEESGCALPDDWGPVETHEPATVVASSGSQTTSARPIVRWGRDAQV